MIPYPGIEVVERLAQTLHDGARSGLLDRSTLPDALPYGIALRVQLALLRRWQDSGERLGGWKVGMTSGKARDKFGPNVRPFGFILKSRIFRSGASIRFGDVPNAAIEPELAFLIARPLRGGSVSEDDARNAIAGVAPAFEIQQRRIPIAENQSLWLADDLGQWGITVGTTRPWSGTAAATMVSLSRDDELATSVGPGHDIDEPILSIRNLCRALHEYGLGLDAGQYVMTGSFSYNRVEFPSRWEASFSSAGRVAMHFADTPVQRGDP